MSPGIFTQWAGDANCGNRDDYNCKQSLLFQILKKWNLKLRLRVVLVTLLGHIQMGRSSWMKLHTIKTKKHGLENCITRKSTLFWETFSAVGMVLTASLTDCTASLCKLEPQCELVTASDCCNWSLFQAIKTCAIFLSNDYSYLNLDITQNIRHKGHIRGIWRLL